MQQRPNLVSVLYLDVFMVAVLIVIVTTIWMQHGVWLGVLTYIVSGLTFPFYSMARGDKLTNLKIGLGLSALAGPFTPALLLHSVRYRRALGIV